MSAQPELPTDLPTALGAAWHDLIEATDGTVIKPGKAVLADGLGLVSRLTEYAWMHATTGSWVNSIVRRLHHQISDWQKALKASAQEPVKKTDLKGSVGILGQQMARVVKAKFLFAVAIIAKLPTILQPKPVKQIPLKPLPLPPEHKFAELEQKLALLEGQHPTFKEEFNESIFRTSRELYQLRTSLPKGRLAKDDPLRVQLRTAEKRLQALNPNLPRVRDIVKAREPLKETLAETVESLCQKGQMSAEDLTRDSALFSLSEQEAKCLYAKRVVKSGRTGFHLSTVTGIERTWKEMHTQGKSEGVTIAFEEGQIKRHVVFIPQEGEVYVKEESLPPGSFKVASLASNFFDVKKTSERSRVAILQPLEELPPEVMQDSSDAISSGSMVIHDVEDVPKFFDEEALQREQKRERQKREQQQREYQREADFCRELGRLPGIWPTHRVTTVDGEIALIQEAAGFIPQQEGEPAKIIDFAGMQVLLNSGSLPISEKKRYLDIMEEALEGVESLHKRGIIHRDLKLPNLLISREGRGFVSDLGTLCHTQGDDEKRVPVGSPDFMPPEIAILTRLTESSEAWKAIDTQADIWSLGVILWELASGKPSHEHPSIQLTAYKSSSDDPIRGVGLLAEITSQDLENKKDKRDRVALKKRYLEEYQPGPPGSLAHLVWRCTRPNPAERPSLDEVRSFYRGWTQHVKSRLDRGEITAISACFSDVW